MTRWPAGLLLVAVTGLVGPAAYAVDDVECVDASSLTDSYVTTQESRPLLAMDLDRVFGWLARQGEAMGAGVVVAVVDSGVGAPAGIDVVESPEVVPGLELKHYHGTAVAGVVSGRPRPAEEGGAVGVAPAAQVLDLQVYDDPTGTDGTPILTSNVVKALDVVLDRVEKGMNVRVVTIALNVAPDDALQQRIRRLWRAGVVTVAPTGNRPSQETESFVVPEEFDEFAPGENARDVVHPAAYEHVLAVSASMTGAESADPHQYVLENSSTDLAAPTAGGVSYTVNGGTCRLSEPATSWATAEVSGALALLFSHFPDDTPAQAVARLLLTADGRPDVPNRLLGAGEVQPYDALTRPLALDADGVAEQTAPEPDTRTHAAPVAEPDPLSRTRHDMVWWGLLGGGAVALALVLRPVLGRRVGSPPSRGG